MVEVVLTNFSVSFWKFFKIFADSVDHCGSWNLCGRLESSFLSVKNSENHIEIALQTVTLYVVERPDLFPEHPAWQTYKQKTALFFIFCRRASTDLHRVLHAHRGRPSHFCTPNLIFASGALEKFGENCLIAVFCL